MMSDDDVLEPHFNGDEEQAIAEDEVISAARSCSAIFVIIAVVGAILCISLGIAYAF
jgi:hypothetical protein